MIYKEYGPKIGIDTNEVYYIQGDFNGDNRLDIAVMIYPYNGRYEIKSYKIRRGNCSKECTPKPKGDSIFVEYVAKGTRILYWNGKPTYLLSKIYQHKMKKNH